MDKNDVDRYTVEVSPPDESALISISNPDVFLLTLVEWSQNSTHLHAAYNLSLRRSDHEGAATLTVTTDSCGMRCQGGVLYSSVEARCPPTKAVRFDYDIDDASFLAGSALQPDGTPLLELLPVNYRPPSRLGRAIPLCDSIYNADPTQPKYFNTDARSQATGRFKQCLHATSVAACGCQDWMRLSQSQNYSDCIRYVYRVYYPDGFSIPLAFWEDGERQADTTDTFTVHEENDRTDWCISGLGDCTDRSVVESTVMGLDSVITFSGAELYHFRITLNSTSFCSFTTEAVIWVYEPGVQTQVMWSTISITASIFGVLVWLMYLVYFQIHGRRFQT